MMKQEGGRPASPAGPRNQAGSYLSTRGLLIVFATLTVGLVLGYLLLSKLIDMSQEEDCALAHRYNCGAVEVPR
jgi:NADH:ubiquinone oxidoreductase subunit 3 (subunit A)